MKLLKLFTAVVAAALLSGCVSGTTIRLSSDAYFSTGSATIKPSARYEIQSTAARIQRNLITISRVIVAGNTDNVGGASYNITLSQRRAQAVANELIRAGVPAHMIDVYGYGESKPAATNSTAQGRALNRRVDVIIQGSLLLP